MSSPVKVMSLRALYQVEEKFIIPEGIELDNKELVESYEVEDHVLTIKMVNGEVITVDSDDDSCRIYNPEPFETIYETDDEEMCRRRDLVEDQDDLFTEIVTKANAEPEPYDGDLETDMRRWKIGRASCRERV